MRARWVAAGLLCLVLAGCGGGGDEPGVATLGGDTVDGSADAGGSKDPEEARMAFADCMRENGVEMADAGPAPGGAGQQGVLVRVEGERDEQRFREAEAQCRHHLEGIAGELSEADRQEMQDAALAFAQCMRDNGVEDHPDPKFEQGRMTMEIAGSEVPNDPDFPAAEKVCRELLPGAGPGMQRAGR